MDSTAEARALDLIRTGTRADWGEAAAVLSAGHGDEGDGELMKLFTTAIDDGDWKRAELVSRILAERDPDRDPSYTAKMFPNRVAKPASAGGFVDWVLGDLPPGSEEWGVTRLRRLDPVRLFAEQLGKGSGLARGTAALRLGDTVDPVAFDVLLPALSDEHEGVRGTAVQAVRRLAVSGLDRQYREHPVRQRITEMLLSDENQAVRIEVARLLCLFGDEVLVADALGKATWTQLRWKRALEAALRGDIPPLPKMWIGDRNV